MYRVTEAIPLHEQTLAEEAADVESLVMPGRVHSLGEGPGVQQESTATRPDSGGQAGTVRDVTTAATLANVNNMHHCHLFCIQVVKLERPRPGYHHRRWRRTSFCIARISWPNNSSKSAPSRGCGSFTAIGSRRATFATCAEPTSSAMYRVARSLRQSSSLTE